MPPIHPYFHTPPTTGELVEAVLYVLTVGMIAGGGATWSVRSITDAIRRQRAASLSRRRSRRP